MKFILLSLLLLIHVGHVHAKTCEASLDISTKFGKLAEGLSERGFLSAEPEPTPELLIEGLKDLVMEWGLKIYPVKSIEEARKHNEFLLNRELSPKEVARLGEDHYISPPDMPLYILVDQDPKEFLPLYDEENKTETSNTHATFHKLATTNSEYSYSEKAEFSPTNVFHFNLDGSMQMLSPTDVKRFTNIIYNKNNDEDHFFYQKGWFAPHHRGIESITRFMTSSKTPNNGSPGSETTEPLKLSKTYNEMSKRLRNLYKKGYRVTFNKAMERVLILAGLQERIGRDNKVSKTTDVEKSRYNKQKRENYLLLQALGQAYSVEIWDGDPEDPDTILLGGTFGLISGTIVSVDSLAYEEMRKVRNFNDKKEALFLVGKNGVIRTYEKALALGEELKQKDIEKGLSADEIAENQAHYKPRESYIWEDHHKDQTNADGEIEYKLDENGEVEYTPRGEFADYANLALYEELKNLGIEYTDVAMVTPKSHKTFKARYENLADAIQLMRDQSKRLEGVEILLPASDQIYRPTGFTDSEYEKILAQPSS